MVFRRCFCGRSSLCMVNAARNAWEEVVRDRGVLSQQFPGLGSRDEKQETSS